MAIKFFTDREIDEIAFRLKSLDYKQRELVRDLLKRLRSGGIGEFELKRELRKLREDHLISETDRHAIEEAVFGGA